MGPHSIALRWSMWSSQKSTAKASSHSKPTTVAQQQDASGTARRRKVIGSVRRLRALFSMRVFCLARVACQAAPVLSRGAFRPRLSVLCLEGSCSAGVGKMFVLLGVAVVPA